MDRFENRVAIALVILAAIMVGGAVAHAVSADQGAPGRQGPWGVVLVPANGLISIANKPVTLSPTAVLGSSCIELTTAVAGMASGHPCAEGGPDNPGMTVQCITAADLIKFRFCNASLAPGVTAGGNYTAVVF